MRLVRLAGLLVLTIALALMLPLLHLKAATTAKATRKGVRWQRCRRKEQHQQQGRTAPTIHLCTASATANAAVRTVSLRPPFESSVVVSITTAPINMLRKSFPMMSPHSSAVADWTNSNLCHDCILRATCKRSLFTTRRIVKLCKRK
jgi:hypothetical protein